MLSIWKENHSNTAILYSKKNSKDCTNGNTQCISQDTVHSQNVFSNAFTVHLTYH